MTFSSLNKQVLADAGASDMAAAMLVVLGKTWRRENADMDQASSRLGLATRICRSRSTQMSLDDFPPLSFIPLMSQTWRARVYGFRHMRSDSYSVSLFLFGLDMTSISLRPLRATACTW